MRQSSSQLGLVMSLAAGGLALFDGSRFLWYNEPATDWETGALPIGCGRLGATVFGGADEVITITEDTIWSGPIQNRIPEHGLEALSEARELLLAGNISAGGEFVLREMSPLEESERAFSYFGNLNLAFGHTDPVNYVRWLDTKQGTSGSSYTHNGLNFS